MNWIKQAVTRDIIYNDLAEEMRLHLEEKTERLIEGGMDRKEAESQARREFGNVTLIEERSREVWQWPTLESISADVRFALRQLGKSPSFTIASVLTLALGIGANTAIFSAMKAVLMAPLPYKDPSRIVVVGTANPASGGQPVPSTAGDFAAWKRSGIFDDLAPSYDTNMTMTGQGAPQFLVGYAVSADYLRILGAAPQIGRLYTDEEDKPGDRK